MIRGEGDDDDVGKGFGPRSIDSSEMTKTLNDEITMQYNTLPDLVENWKESELRELFTPVPKVWSGNSGRLSCGIEKRQSHYYNYQL